MGIDRAAASGRVCGAGYRRDDFLVRPDPPSALPLTPLVPSTRASSTRSRGSCALPPTSAPSSCAPGPTSPVDDTPRQRNSCRGSSHRRRRATRRSNSDIAVVPGSAAGRYAPPPNRADPWCPELTSPICCGSVSRPALSAASRTPTVFCGPRVPWRPAIRRSTRRGASCSWRGTTAPTPCGRSRWRSSPTRPTCRPRLAMARVTIDQDLRPPRPRSRGSSRPTPTTCRRVCSWPSCALDNRERDDARCLDCRGAGGQSEQP